MWDLPVIENKKSPHTAAEMVKYLHPFHVWGTDSASTFTVEPIVKDVRFI